MSQGLDGHGLGNLVLAVFVAEHFAAAVPLAGPIGFRAGLGADGLHPVRLFKVVAQGLDGHGRGDFVLAFFIAEHFAAAVPLAGPIGFRAGLGAGGLHLLRFCQVMAQGICLHFFKGDFIDRGLFGVALFAHPALIVLSDAFLRAGGGGGGHLLDVKALGRNGLSVGAGDVADPFAALLLHVHVAFHRALPAVFRLVMAVDGFRHGSGLRGVGFIPHDIVRGGPLDGVGQHFRRTGKVLFVHGDEGFINGRDLTGLRIVGFGYRRCVPGN